jgi:hypothetical protein
MRRTFTIIGVTLVLVSIAFYGPLLHAGATRPDRGKCAVLHDANYKWLLAFTGNEESAIKGACLKWEK